MNHNDHDELCFCVRCLRARHRRFFGWDNTLLDAVRFFAVLIVLLAVSFFGTLLIFGENADLLWR